MDTITTTNLRTQSSQLVNTLKNGGVVSLIHRSKDKPLLAQIDKFQLVDFSENVATKAVQGTTSDFENNVQLHSAANAACDAFLTENKKLLEMKFFGKVRITNSN